MSRSGNVTASEATGGRAPLEQTVTTRRSELDGISRATAPRAWAAAQVRLGSALFELAAFYRVAGDAGAQRVLYQGRSALQAALEAAGELSPADRATAQQQVLADIRALADRQRDEPALLGKLVRSDLAHAARILDDLKAGAGAMDDPKVWTIWTQAACECLANPVYVAADLGRALSELAEAKARLDRARSPWLRAAMTIHDLLVARDEAAAGALRDEIKALAQAEQDDDAWRVWADTTTDAIRQIRSTDYPKA